MRDSLIITRQGSKSKTCNLILPYIPEHKTYIEPFFGAGGMFFNKQKAKHNILNDLDSEVFNLYYCVKHYPNDLITAIKKTPICQDLFTYWKNHILLNNIDRAVRFIYLSNYSLYGSGYSLCLNGKKHSYLVKSILNCQDILHDCFIFNKPAISFLSSLHSHFLTKHTLIYCDPPYISTTNNYNTPKWSIDNLIDLIDKMIKLPCKFIISEFNCTDIINISKSYNLNVIELTDRKNILNYKTEIILKNF